MEKVIIIRVTLYETMLAMLQYLYIPFCDCHYGKDMTVSINNLIVFQSALNYCHCLDWSLSVLEDLQGNNYSPHNTLPNTHTITCID